MICRACGNDMKLRSSKNVISNSNTPNEQTKLSCVQTFECINPNCTNKGVQQTESHELEFEEK